MDQPSQQRAIARMQRVDDMPAEMRELVHDFGLTIVDAFVQSGVTKPNRIRHLIATVMKGAQEIGDRTDAPRMGVIYALIPAQPTERMIAASMATVANHDVRVTKHEKHRLRLAAALKAGRL